MILASFTETSTAVIFINGNIGKVKIGVLGLTAIVDETHHAHSLLGMPEYMAPELECDSIAKIYKKVTAGVKPQALNKVSDLELKAFIEKCIGQARERPSAADLIKDPFLSEVDSTTHSIVSFFLVWFSVCHACFEGCQINLNCNFMTIGYGPHMDNGYDPPSKATLLQPTKGGELQIPNRIPISLLFSFVLVYIGAGGIRPCSVAYGANQVEQRNTPNNERVLEKFFSWCYAATSISVMAALTFIVYVQHHAGWKAGFGVLAILMLLSAFSFFIASPFYSKQKATMSLFTNFARVIVVCVKNREVALPSGESNLRYHHMSSSTLSEPTNKLRYYCLFVSR
ncbi:hypothetical protein RHGRI_035306 [Rhododendron griersonianum]|uniref:non-specific serine/threonine protein kinase n=1 Tax=Rhododendron griersonianum TaxID=479676 RepID=A0AAV6I6Q4_9ERIC|nr:hypothetical protein RHGRI_035306 [Rhododendron griersonianum]